MYHIILEARGTTSLLSLEGFYSPVAVFFNPLVLTTARIFIFFKWITAILFSVGELSTPSVAGRGQQSRKKNAEYLQENAK